MKYITCLYIFQIVISLEALFDPILAGLLRKVFNMAPHRTDDVIIRLIAFSSHVFFMFGTT